MLNLKKTFALLAALSLLLVFTACSSNMSLIDGSYHAEFSDFDSNGYKDFIDVVIKDGKIVSFVADATDESGALKSESADYRTRMKNVVGNYPEKFYRDFANQYLEKGNAKDIDIVAGATMTTKNLIKLVTAVEDSAHVTGETNLVVDRNE